MKKEIIRTIIYFTLAVIAVSYLIFRYFMMTAPSDFHIEGLVPAAFSVIFYSVASINELVKCHGTYFWTAIRCRIFHPTSKVYVSLSYLLQIKTSGDNLYFLVKGNKIDQYQPVGGVFKIVGSKNIEKDWNAQLKTDKANPRDLRFYVQASKIPEIIQWFKSEKDRETGVWREFREELIDTGIVSEENFKTTNVEFLRTEECILKKETRFDNEKYHTLIYKVYRIELTPEQENEFNRLKTEDKFTEEYAFVERKDIESECFDEHKKRIGQHTKYILQ